MKEISANNQLKQLYVVGGISPVYIEQDKQSGNLNT